MMKHRRRRRFPLFAWWFIAVLCMLVPLRAGAAAAPVEIAGNTGTGLTFETAGEELSAKVVVRSTSARTLRVDVSAYVASGTKTAESLAVQPSTLTLEGFAAETIDFTAKLPEPGEYATTLQLVVTFEDDPTEEGSEASTGTSGGDETTAGAASPEPKPESLDPHRVRILLKRTLYPASLVAETPAEVLTKTDEDATVEFDVRETQGRTVLLREAELDSFTKRVDDEDLLSAVHGTCAVLDIDGETTITSIPSFATRTVRCTLTGTHTAGTHKSRVRVQEIDSTSATPASLTLHLREPWFIAALCIAAGTLLSSVLRLLGYLVPWFENARRTAQLLARVERQQRSAEEKDERKALAKTQTLLLRHRKSWLKGRVDTDILALRVIALELLIETRRQLEGVRPSTEAEESLEECKRIALLLASSELESTTLEEKIEGLKKMPDEVNDKAIKALQSRVEEFEALAKSLTESSASNALIKLGIEGKVQAAKEAIQSERWEVVWAALQDAWNHYVDVQIAHCRQALGNIHSLASSSPRWPEIARSFRAELTALERVDDSRRAPGLLKIALAKLGMELGRLLDDAIASNPPPGDDADELRRKITELRTTPQIDPIGEFNDLALQLQALDTDPTREAAAVVASAPSPMAIEGPMIEPSFHRAQVVVPQEETKPWRYERGVMIALEVVTAIVVGLIAVFLGVQTLWISDLTWGSTADLFTAVVWGLGLHQTSMALTPLREKLGLKPAK